MLGKCVDKGTFRAPISTALSIHSCAVGRLTNSDDVRSAHTLRSFHADSLGHDTFQSIHDGLEMYTKLGTKLYSLSAVPPMTVQLHATAGHPSITYQQSP